jgi:methyl-accepting chemotaxis protein
MAAHQGILAEFEQLEPGQKAALKKVSKLLGPHIGRTLEEFYSKAANDPELSGILAAGPGIDKVVEYQRSHLEPLLAGEASEELYERSRRMGEAHQRMGISAEHHIAAYSHLFEAFIKILLGPRSGQAAMAGALARVISIDMAHGLAAYLNAQKEEASREEATMLSSAIEQEVKHVRRVAGELAQALKQINSEMTGAISEVQAGVQIVEAGSAVNTCTTQSVAEALAEIRESNTEVSGRAAEMSQLAGTAAEKSKKLGVWLDRLRAASVRISAITKLIDGIAKHTNLLALNATIEAGRAGKAGNGFAVVANEIKELSQHSAAAAGQIAQNISGIQSDLNPAIAVMCEIGDLVHKVDSAAAAVSSNVATRISGLNALVFGAEAAADGAAKQSGAVEIFTGAVANASAAAECLGRHAAHLSSMFEGVAKRLSVTVASMADVAERRHSPVPVRIPVWFEYGGKRIETATLTISEAGGLIDAVAGEPPEGSLIELYFAGIGSIAAEAARRHPLGIRFRFVKVGPDAVAALQGCMGSVSIAEERLRKRLARCRDEIEHAIAQGIAQGKISLEAMFDENYQPIPGTNPLQVQTEFLPFLEQVLPPIQEPVLEFDPHIAFCNAVDRNGYLPVHNAKYSKPQGADPVWNHVNCRNRRIFDDKTGLTAARNEQEFLTQIYPRDMGGGTLKIMRDISTPIQVAGRNWGAVRMGAEVPFFSPLERPVEHRQLSS